MENYLENYLVRLDQNSGFYEKIAGQIWSFAEIGYYEHKSAALLIETLEKEGFSIQREAGGIPTAFVAHYGTEGPIIAFLGEYDALPGLSQAAISERRALSPNAPGHGCGHNLLGVAPLAASIELKKAIEEGKIRGSVRYYGCPAEENGDGKVFMVKAGLFGDVDLAFCWHPATINTVVNYNCLANYSVIFHFHGRSAHAAFDPHNGRSGLDAVELMNSGMNYLREHVTPDVRFHYVIIDGGTTPNVVPEHASVWYFIRAEKNQSLASLYERVLKVAEGAASMTETGLQVQFLGASSNLLNNDVIEKVLNEKLMQMGSPSYTEEEKRFALAIQGTFSSGAIESSLRLIPEWLAELKELIIASPLCTVVIPPFGKGRVEPGSTDVGDVSWVTPTGQFNAACSAIGTPAHSWQEVAQAGMSIGFKGMLLAAKVFLASAWEFYTEPGLITQAKAEFDRKIAKTPYVCPIPDGVEPPFDHIKRMLQR